jgi:hypothetical protein
MDETVYFVAVPYDLTDRGLIAGQQFKCISPVTAIEHAKQMWKTFGHAGAAAFVRTGYPATRTTLLRTYGLVPDDLDDDQSYD